MIYPRSLRWIWSRTNLCTNYQRTFGYDDAIIRKDKDSGGIKILYRKGALIWMRPPGGVGDFEAECPLTPHNIKMLISGYPNKKWYIVDDDIREIVKAGWEKKLSLMDENTKQFNETWFKAMHTLKAEMGEKGVGAEAEVSMEKLELKEKQKDVAIREQEVSQREVRVKEQLAEVGETMSTLVEKGASIGANSTIICGVKIGRGAMVGAGSVVTNDIPPNTLVIGNPAKPMGEVE